MKALITAPTVPNPAPSALLARVLNRLGGLLLRHGCPTHRLEDCLRIAATAHGHRAEVFAVSTGLWMSLEDGQTREVTVRLTRIDEWNRDIGRLCALDEIFNRLASGVIDADAADAELDAVQESPPIYPNSWRLVAGALTTASAAVFFGGASALTICLAAVVGLVTTSITSWLGRGRGRLLIDFVTGALTGLALWCIAAVDPELPRRPLLLAGIIVAVPGLTLTAGLSELAQKNIVSGTGRLMEAGMVLISLVFGLAVTGAMEAYFMGAQGAGGPEVAATPYLECAAAVVGALTFAVLFEVPIRLAPGAIVGGFLAWLSTVPDLPSATAGFVGALGVGLFSNLCARITDRPAQAFLVPGIILLVPGVFGFVSFSQLLSGDITSGASGFAATVTTAGALAIGLLFANVLLSARKVL